MTSATPSSVRYYCHVCGREAQVDASLHCRQCASEFVEEIESPTPPAVVPPAPAAATPPVTAIAQPMVDPFGAIFGSMMNALLQSPLQSVRISAPIAAPISFNYPFPPQNNRFAPGDYVGNNTDMTFIINQLFHQFNGGRSGNGSPPTPPSVISSLTVTDVTPEVINSLSGDKVCVICQSEITDSNEPAQLIILPGCQHYFHRTCITPWLMQHSQCPTCRRNILDNNNAQISPT